MIPDLVTLIKYDSDSDSVTVNDDSDSVKATNNDSVSDFTAVMN